MTRNSVGRTCVCVILKNRTLRYCAYSSRRSVFRYCRLWLPWLRSSVLLPLCITSTLLLFIKTLSQPISSYRRRLVGPCWLFSASIRNRARPQNQFLILHLVMQHLSNTEGSSALALMSMAWVQHSIL